MKFRRFIETLLGYEKRLPKEAALQQVIRIMEQIFQSVRVNNETSIAVLSSGRRISFNVSNDDWLTLMVNFNWSFDREPTFHQNSDRENQITPVFKSLQGDSLSFMKKLQAFIKAVNPLGVRLKFLSVTGADKNDRRDKLYSKMLTSGGYRRMDDTWVPSWMLNDSPA